MSLEDFGITRDDWKEMLDIEVAFDGDSSADKSDDVGVLVKTVFDNDSKILIGRILHATKNGQSVTFEKLSVVYGGYPKYYERVSVLLAKRVIRYLKEKSGKDFDYDTSDAKDGTKYLSLLFDGEESIGWILKENLASAFLDCGLAEKYVQGPANQKRRLAKVLATIIEMLKEGNGRHIDIEDRVEKKLRGSKESVSGQLKRYSNYNPEPNEADPKYFYKDRSSRFSPWGLMGNLDLIETKYDITDPIEYSSEDGFDPKISKEEYKQSLKYLRDSGYTKYETLYLIYRQGGAASCSQLAGKYSKLGDADIFRGNGADTGKKIAQYLGRYDEFFSGKAKKHFYAVVFLFGKTKRSSSNLYWKLRPSLKEAISELEQEGFFDELRNRILEGFSGDKMSYDTTEIKKLLEENKQIILTGAPGTGKTFLSRQIAEELVKKELGKGNNEDLTEDERKEYIHFCQFHPSYDYTDFVEGLRPKKLGDNSIGFERKDGIFKEFCKKAINEPDKKFVFMIDEINRGDISKIFGELFYAIDPGYRGEKGKTDTQYQNLLKDNNDDPYKDGFYVPDNVYIIGTMNDIDRSVESMDFAIRRRFIWYPINPEDTQDAILEKTLNADDAISLMKVINKKIKSIDGLGEAFQLGASYFKAKEREGEEKTEVNLEYVWEYRVKPLLKEYLRGLPNETNAWDELKKCWPLNQNDESGENQDSEDA